MKLRDAYESYHRVAHSHKPRTVQEYQGALRHWERLTDNPDVAAVDNATMLRFRAALESCLVNGLRLSAGTVRKNLVEIQSIFATIGPAQHGNLYGLGLIAKIPICRKPDVSPRAIVTASDAEVRAIHEHCHVATWPQWGGDPAVWWRCLVVYLYCIGSRRNEFLGLRFADVDLDSRQLRIDPLKRGRHPCKPIPEILAEQMRPMVDPDRELWFACSRYRKHLYDTWRDIQLAAGVFVPRGVGDRLRPVYCFHELRKTSGTAWYGVSPGAAQHMLGHSDMRTTERHYANTQTIVENAVDRLPQPFESNSAAPEPPRTDSPPALKLYAG